MTAGTPCPQGIRQDCLTRSGLQYQTSQVAFSGPFRPESLKSTRVSRQDEHGKLHPSPGPPGPHLTAWASRTSQWTPRPPLPKKLLTQHPRDRSQRVESGHPSSTPLPDGPPPPRGPIRTWIPNISKRWAANSGPAQPPAGQQACSQRHLIPLLPQTPSPTTSTNTIL